jgi:hypothetical protein
VERFGQGGTELRYEGQKNRCWAEWSFWQAGLVSDRGGGGGGGGAYRCVKNRGRDLTQKRGEGRAWGKEGEGRSCVLRLNF